MMKKSDWKKWISPHFTKSEILRIFLVIILLGLFVSPFLKEFGIVSVLIGIIILLAAILWKNVWWAFLAVLFLSVGYAHIFSLFHEKNDTLKTFHGQILHIDGVVSNFPDTREKNVRVFVKTEKGTLLFIAPPTTKLHYGDSISFTGTLERPRNFDDFDYRKYLRRFNVETIVRNPQIREIKHSFSGGNRVLRWAENIRNFLAQNLESSLPIPHSSIGMGILLGVKNQLPEAVQTDFKRSGLQHLLVVSGFNVTILIVFLSFLLKKFGKRVVFGGTSIALIFFVAMTGAEPPIIRAALMGTLVGWAATSGQFSDVRNVFLLSIVLMGIWNPLVVQSDIGFFLSSAATLGIILGVPLLSKVLSPIPNIWHIRTLLSVTLSAQIAVFPILGVYFGEFPVAGILANLFAEPLVPLGMLFSFMSSIAGILPESIAQMVGIPAFILLELLLSIAQIFGKISPVPLTPTISMAGMGILFLFFLWGIFSRSFSKKFLTFSPK
jgi:competence protein ComEC